MTRTETADEACSHVSSARPNNGKFSQKFTKGTLYYIEKPVNGEKLYTNLLPSEQAENSTDSNLRRDKKEIVVYDIRTAGKPFSLLTNGFEIAQVWRPKEPSMERLRSGKYDSLVSYNILSILAWMIRLDQNWMLTCPI